MFISPQKTKNAYRLWDVHAQEGFIITVLFEEIKVVSAFEDKTFLFFGEDTNTFNGNKNTCDAWISLINNEGQIENRYRKFASKGPSAKVIFSSLSVHLHFKVKFSATQLTGTFVGLPNYNIFSHFIITVCNHNCFLV